MQSRKRLDPDESELKSSLRRNIRIRDCWCEGASAGPYQIHTAFLDKGLWGADTGWRQAQLLFFPKYTLNLTDSVRLLKHIIQLVYLFTRRLGVIWPMSADHSVLMKRNMKDHPSQDWPSLSFSTCSLRRLRPCLHHTWAQKTKDVTACSQTAGQFTEACSATNMQIPAKFHFPL